MSWNQEEPLLAKTSDFKVTARLLRYVRPYKLYVFTALLLTLINAPLALASAPLTKAAIDLYLKPDHSQPLTGLELLISRGANYAGMGNSPFEGVLFLSGLFLFASIAGMVVGCAQAFLLQRLGQMIMRDLREEVFDHLQTLPIKYYDRNPVGRLQTRLTTDVEALNEMFTSGVILVVGDIATAIYIILYMFGVNWRLALITLFILPMLILLTHWFRRGIRESLADIRVRIAGINAFLQEHLSSMSTVQLFNAEERELRKFDLINYAHLRANIKTVFYYAFFFPAVQLIAAVVMAFVIWYGGGQVIAGLATLGTLVAFLQLTRSFFQPVSEITDKFNIVQAAIAASERIFALLDQPSTNRKSSWQAKPLRGRVEFRNVWFAYNDEDWVLKNVSFVAEAGESLALVGHTGAGKSTIASLLLRFYAIQRGEILLDGKDIRTMDERELRSHFGVVLQDVYLFSGDIASNIRLNNSDITDEQLQLAAQQVHAYDFIKKLPQGFATPVNERGAGFSFGEKQLICFARALISKPGVLILDEATRSIDAEKEYLISDAVRRLMEGHTSLIIAHRLSTVGYANKIIVLHQGEIKETGTHQELLALRGIYWRLCRLHFDRSSENVAVEPEISSEDTLALSLAGS